MPQKVLLPILFFLLMSYSLKGEIGIGIEENLAQLNKATATEKIVLSKQFVKDYFSTHLAQVIQVSNDRLEDGTLSDIDRIFFIQEKARTYFFHQEQANYAEQAKLATTLLNQYKGDKNEEYYLLKYEDILMNNYDKLFDNLGSSEIHEVSYKALEFAKQSTNSLAIAKANRRIGNLHYQNEDLDKAQIFYQKCLNAPPKPLAENKTSLSLYYTNLHYDLANLYLKKEQLNNAIIYIKKIDRKKFPSERLLLEAKWQSAKNNFIAANISLDTLLQGDIKFAHRFRPYANLEKGNNYFQLRAFDQAEESWQLARKEFVEIGRTQELKQVLQNLYQYYENNSNYRQALFHLEEYKVLNDSINKSNYSVVQEKEKKSKELVLSKQENAFLKEQATVSQTTIQRQRIFAFISIIVVGIVLALLRKSILLLKDRKKSNQTLQSLYQDIELKNKEHKVFGEKIDFWVQNIKHAIIGLDEHYNIIFSNEHFSKNVDDFEDKKGRNIFDLLGFPKEEQSALLNTLVTNELVEFIWLNPNNDGVYKILVKQMDYKNANLSYGVIMRDLTEIKANELQKTDILQSNIEQKKKELATKVMQIMKRTSNLEGIMTDLNALGEKASCNMQARFTKITNQINNLLDIKSSWASFQTYFMEIHPSFLQKINSDESLTDNEIRHCCYIKLGLSNHEIASMLYISPKSVEATHYRIKKKMNLTKDDSLRQFIRTE